MQIVIAQLKATRKSLKDRRGAGVALARVTPTSSSSAAKKESRKIETPCALV